jgi:hypothetical protein
LVNADSETAITADGDDVVVAIGHLPIRLRPGRLG